MGILRQLGLAEEISARLRPFPNGATAMKAMSESSEDGLLGCTQITEISFTPGVELVAALPAEFELATVYTAALCSHAAQAGLARELIAQLASDQSLALRQSCGFEV
jgi:molybdate transport system substrate-binding protein